MNEDQRPIGLFDSGIGGLTVLRSLYQALPHEHFIYLGDTARLPYGTKSTATIERYLRQNVRYLETLGVKAVVVACNSASSVLLGKDLKKDFGFNIPVYNVIEPGAETALKHSPRKRILVLGTRATVAGKAYIHALTSRAQDLSIWQQACPLLVPLVEEGWDDDPITNLIVFRYLNPLLAQDPDVLILGCTHYPVLKRAFEKVTSGRVALIDGADAVAAQLATDIAQGHIGAAKKSGAQDESKRLEILVSDDSPHFLEVAARLLNPQSLPPARLIDVPA